MFFARKKQYGVLKPRLEAGMVAQPGQISNPSFLLAPQFPDSKTQAISRLLTVRRHHYHYCCYQQYRCEPAHRFFWSARVVEVVVSLQARENGT